LQPVHDLAGHPVAKGVRVNLTRIGGIAI
jgi:hypothetical protein